MIAFVASLFVFFGAVRTQTPPTFNRDVAPIVFQHCVGCHREDGSAPFALATYGDVGRRAQQIAEVTASGRMPPWLPRHGYGHFAGERRLTPGEIRVLREWAAHPVEGEVAHGPKPPALSSGWRLGEPDLIIDVPPYVLPADGRDVYRNFVLPIAVEEPRFVRAVEFRPGSMHSVHHARMLVDRTGASRRLDSEDDEPGYDGMLVDKAEFPDGIFLGWAPGKASPRGSEVDDALVWRVLPGTDLILQLHMLPTGKRETVRGEVAFFFTADAPKRRAAVLQLGSKTIDIPPGARAHVVEDRYVLPADVEAIGIYPHAHYICREMQVVARRPDGREEWLLWIPEWDFYWQDEYRYQSPVFLPEGTEISMRFVYDNGAENPRNPYAPPRRVRFGPLSTDEMGDVVLMLVPREPERLGELREGFLRNELRQDVLGYQKSLEESPNDPELRNALGFAYWNLGRTEDATVQWEEAVRSRPDFAEALYNLAGARIGAGQIREGARAYRDAIAASPSYPEAHNNLGVVLQSQGRLDEAMSHYRRAIEVRPDYGYARANLGNALLAQAKVDEAIEQLRAAIRIDPEHAEAHYSLAAALGRQGLLEDEIAHYRLAILAKPDYAEALHNLGAVLTLVDRAPEAVRPLREAVRLRPDYALAHASLGRALAATGDLDAAALSFRKTIALRPEDVAAHRDLGDVLTRARRYDEALTHFRIAVRLGPDDVGTLSGLAWIFAVHPNRDRRDAEKAVRFAERAASLAPSPDATTLDVLAAAYAADGRFDEAVRTAEAALARARSQPDALVNAITARLELYAGGKPYRAP